MRPNIKLPYFIARHIDTEQEEEWWETFMRISLIFVSATAGFAWTFLPAKWHTSAAYVYINEMRIPFLIWGIIFLLQAFLIAMPLRIRLLGYLSGCVTCTFFGILLSAAALKGYSTSPLGPAGLISFGVIHLAGCRNYLFKRAELVERVKNGVTIEG